MNAARSSGGVETAPPAIRLDKWLWHARLCKTRSLAARLIAEGRVRVNTVRVLKPATLVRVGDGITFARDGRILVLRVRALGDRRGPAPEARSLYADLEASLPESPAALEHGPKTAK